MDNGNGRTLARTPTDDDIARSIVTSLHTRSSRDVGADAPPAAWMTFASTLDRLIAANPALAREVETALARSARLALADGGAAVPSVADFVAGLHAPAVTRRGGTVVRAFWWGFHIQISHEDLMNFLSVADPVNEIIGAIGGGIPSPAAPFIALAAAFVAGALDLLRGLDHGGGVYISMSWFAPGIFIPTSV